MTRPSGFVVRARRVGRLSLLWLLAWSNPSHRTAYAQDAEPLPDPLRLEQVLQIARDHRAEIEAARARSRAAAERPAIVSALEDPVIFPSIDHLPFMLQGVDYSVSVEQRFPLSGVRGHRRESAEADSQRFRAETDRVALDVELDAVTAFLMLQERRRIGEILGEQRRLSREFVDAAVARYSAGTGTQSDVLRAEIEVSRLDAALRSIDFEVRAVEAMLNTGLGRSADLPVPALESPPLTELPPSTDTVREAALSKRPELRAGEAEIGRSLAEVSVMKTMYSPMAMVRTGPSYTMTDGAGWMVMVGISLPLWRDRLHAGVAEAEAMVDMARADLEAMRRMVEGDAVAKREETLASRERFFALRDEVVPRARQAIDPTLAGYAAGQLPLVSVIDAAQTLWSVEAELAAAELGLGLSWARLKRATGDWGFPP
jgi:outer membrane protein TolC